MASYWSYITGFVLFLWAQLISVSLLTTFEVLTTNSMTVLSVLSLFLKISWSHIFLSFLSLGKETPCLRLSLLRQSETLQVNPPVLAPDAILDQWLQLPELFARVTSSCKWAISIFCWVFDSMPALENDVARACLMNSVPSSSPVLLVSKETEFLGPRMIACALAMRSSNGCEHS